MNYETSSNYTFQHIFNGIQDIQSSFDKYYAPLVKQTAHGESTLLTFCGLSLTNSFDYFLSKNGRIGFLSSVTQLLLRAAIVDGQDPGIVTMSWYKIDCGNNESILDLLRSSSPLHQQKSPDPNLILRELGKGRGMIVPGVWEVELNTPQDVDAVINHVHRLYPTSLHDGLSHTVFQFTIAPHDLQSKITHTKTGSKTAVNDDRPGVGRISIILLSNLSHIKNLSYTDPLVSQHADPGSTIPPSPHVDCFPWIHLTNDILHWMESRRPSPPFHKSRILLLLRDALCLRMPSVFTLFLSPTVVDLPDNSSWLNLLTRISQVTQERFNSGYTIKHNPMSVPVSLPLNQSQSQTLRDTAKGATTKTSIQSQSHITPKKDRIGNVTPPRGGSSEKLSRNISPITRQYQKERDDRGDVLERTQRGASASMTGGLDTQNQNQDPQNKQSIRPSRGETNHYMEKYQQQHPSLAPESSFPGAFHPPPLQDQSSYSTFSISSLRSERVNSEPQQEQSHVQGLRLQKQAPEPRHQPPSSYLQQHQQQRLHQQPSVGPQNQNERSPNPPPPPPATSVTGQERRRGSTVMSIKEMPPQSPSQGSPEHSTHNPQIIYMPSLPEGAMDAEGAQALISSLEALRNEVHTLRHALSVSQQRFVSPRCSSLLMYLS